MKDSTPFTFDQFMEATKGAKDVAPEAPKTDRDWMIESITQSMKDFGIKKIVTDKGQVLVDLEAKGKGEKKVILEGAEFKKHFYTKTEAKEYAQKRCSFQLRWFKKNTLIYTRNPKGELIFKITEGS